MICTLVRTCFEVLSRHYLLVAHIYFVRTYDDDDDDDDDIWITLSLYYNKSFYTSTCLLHYS